MPAKLLAMKPEPPKVKSYLFLDDGKALVRLAANPDGTLDAAFAAVRLAESKNIHLIYGEKLEVLVEYVSDDLQKKLSEIVTALDNIRKRSITHKSRLSTQQRIVFDQVMAGDANKEIANAMNLTVRTVKFHVSGILSKLDCDNRGELFKKYRHVKSEEL